MRFIYEVGSSENSSRFFYSDEGAAIQAVRRDAMAKASELNTEIRIPKWVDSMLLITVIEPREPSALVHEFHYQRHSVL